MATVTYPESALAERRNPIIDWLTTVDHKKIGILYVVTNVLFFLFAGFLALIMRAELALPGGQIISADQYQRLFSMHGTIMVFLVGVPIWAGFGNYLVPLQIGARDMAFPRLNALSFWMFLFGAMTIMATYVIPGGAPAVGWTGYAPLSGPLYSPGNGVDLWAIGIIITGASSTIGAVNFITTILNMRAPGMTMFKLPVFTWTIFVMAFMVLLATPMLAGALSMNLADRNLGTQFFQPGNGDPILWQHLFWFYSHPAVYIMVLPAMGIVSEILPVFSRKPLFGYAAIVWSTIAIGAMGFTTWAHHMFTSGLAPAVEAFFVISTMVIAVPTGVKMFNWIFTMVGGSIKFDTPLLFSLGFLSMFLIGGISGVINAIIPLNNQLHDTYWVVAHLHYVLFGGSIFGLFAGLYFWIPKVTGWMMDEKLGKLHFALKFIGFNLTFFPMHILGLLGMPRRYFDYPATRGWTEYNIAATVGGFIIGIASIVFIVNLIYSAIKREEAGDDPWEADTLEWATTSPPPFYNFPRIPVVKSLRPVRDARLEIQGKMEPAAGD